MSYLFGHLIGAWLVGQGYQFLSKKKLDHYAWFFLLAGGIIPDLDYLLDWTLGTAGHRTLTHSVIFLVGAPLLLYGILTLLKKEESKIYAWALAGGIMMHLLLDMHSSPGVPLLWPSLQHFSYFQIQFYNPATPSFFDSSSIEDLGLLLKRAVLDMALGAGWVFYLWWRRRIEF